MARVSTDTSCRIVDAAEEQVWAGAAVLALRVDVVHQRSHALREATGDADVQVVMSMMSQDGPSKRRRTPGGKDVVDLAVYSTSPKPWLPPTLRVRTEHIMPRPSTMPWSKSRFG